MRKLIIQVPCYNEAETLAVTLGDLPRQVAGYDRVEWLVIDDGSTDRTVEVARECGVDYIVSLPHNQGLAKAFMAGLEASLTAGADTIVNTDADNQYSAASIPDLVRPIVERKAQIVVGARPISDIEHFSPLKKLLERIGSWTVRMASNTAIADAPSGFRAIHRSAALSLNTLSSYTYTLETIIQAGHKNISIVSVPIRVNGYLRPSRLVKTIPNYIKRSLLTILRIFIVYRPLRFFTLLGIVLLIPGLFLGGRFVVYYMLGQGEGHVQSLILTAILIISSFLVMLAGILADLIATNRLILEEVRTRLLRFDIARRGQDQPQKQADLPTRLVASPSRVSRTS
ncbi:MAG: glycosyltransferase family 2 protein [Beggiatoa sp.]|nr:glycosyltransferase family 2 protein [Beggiatoa sp.]